MRARTDTPVPTVRGQLLALASAALAAIVMTTTTAASGPSVLVEPVRPLPVGIQTLTVTGSGFDPAGNRGNGIYVVFGPIVPAPTYYLDPSIYAAFKWVHPTGQDSSAESPMAADGSFSTTLEVPSSFEGPMGSIDCTAVPCAVITFGAHGSQDRSQDTCTALTFVTSSASGSPGPAASAAVSGTAAPLVEASPSGPAPSAESTVSPVPGGPCDAIGGGTGS